MPKNNHNSARYTIPTADAMRADVGASASSLAAASNCSRDTVRKVLDVEPTQKVSCERVINGLKRLNHPTASMDDIVELSEA